MSAPPYMTWYPADYLRDTRHLTTEQHGAYRLLIDECWMREGLIPDDDRLLARLAGFSPAKWDRHKSCVMAFFTWTPEGWRHKRVSRGLDEALSGIKRAASWRNRLNKRRPLPDDWVELRRQIFARDNYTCTYCHARGGRLECDHMTPIARGGGNEVENLTTACKACNQTKGTKTAEEFRGAMQ